MHSEAEREGERREQMRFSRDETREMQFWLNACMHCVCAPSPSGWMIGWRKVMLAPLGARAIEALACNGHSTKPKQAARVRS